ncbi:hypothetical protein [Telluribacter sp. SYSU D00476]|uniref:hypothetical protein n=1 Tax=Telluribacter sp. SYSU D00476 TaxID=2811430 RepID=UPI001FF2DC35|nr:hypothetical protein [Telluribacter sp. SYSU D00476]
MLKPYLLWGLLLLASTLSPSVHAQLSKGTRYWGGTVEFSGNASKSKRPNSAIGGEGGSFEVMPEVQWGRFRNATTLWGLGLGYTYQSSRSESISLLNGRDIQITDQTGNSHIIGFRPFFRKYKLFNDRWGIFLHTELQVNYTQRRFTSRNGGYGANEYRNTINFWGGGLSIRPGIMYRLGQRGWSLEGYANVLGLGLNYDRLPDGDNYFTFSSYANSSFPSLITLRVARYF